MASQIKRRIITGANQWTEPLYVPSGLIAAVSVRSTGGGVVSVQRNVSGSDWQTVKRYEDADAPAEEAYGPDASVEIRIGVATGDYVGEAEVQVAL